MQYNAQHLEHRQKNVTVILFVAVMLIGCLTARDSSADLVATETASPTLSANTSPTRTLRMTSSAAPTVTQPPQLTKVPPAAFAYPEGDYLFTDTSECSLPCWHGLQIGTSDLAAFHRVVRDVFGFDDTHLGGVESAGAFPNLSTETIALLDITGYKPEQF